MAVSTVGITKQTAERLLLDAGAIYKNLVYENGEFTGEALGATSGGNEFTVEIEQRQPEIDGLKSRVRGMSFVETHEASLVVNLKELTAQNIKLAIYQFLLKIGWEENDALQKTITVFELMKRQVEFNE